MSHPIFIIDAFTDRPFAGNPAAVCLLETSEQPDTPWHQAVAAEMNLSETAFVRPRSRGDGYDLRWFTPAVEVPLCGHATLASAQTLWQTGQVPTHEVIRFHTLSGVLEARRRFDDRIELDLPTQVLREAEPPAEAMTALGVAPRRVLRTTDRAGGDHDFLVEIGSEREVRTAKPDFRRLAAVDTKAGWIVTARADATPGADFVSRYFCPAWGIDEDPVTGVAHCSLVPHWQALLGGDEVTGFQASRRGGWVVGRHQGDRAVLAGHAVTVLAGTLA